MKGTLLTCRQYGYTLVYYETWIKIVTPNVADTRHEVKL